MTAITVTMRSTTQRQDSGTTQTGTDSVQPGHATGFMSLNRPVYCQHRRHACLASIFLLKTGNTSRDWAHNPLETGREAPAFRPLFCPVLFLIWTHTVYLKNSVSHITRSLPRQDVTGDGGFFFWSPRVNLNVEVKQTPDEAVAGRQPAL